MKKLLVYCFIAITSIFSSCGVTDSEEKLQPGRRDYAWTVDTIKSGFTTLRRIWGDSPNDVWAVGQGGDQNRTIYRFDGKKWRTDMISRPFAPMAIWGSSSSDVWIAGYGGEFWHYNGISLQRWGQLEIAGCNNLAIENIWGDAADNVFALGSATYNNTYKALFAKYDGSAWKEVSIPNTNRIFYQIAKFQNEQYLISAIGYNPLSPDTNSLYAWNSGNLINIANGYDNGALAIRVEKIRASTLVLIGNILYKYADNKLAYFRTIDLENFGKVFFGRTESDLFFIMFDGIVHFDGTDYKYLFRYDKNVKFLDSIIFEKQIFILLHDFNNNINLVLRGN